MDMAQDESLPNRFPPQRQNPQYYGMLSDYAKGHVMTQSVPTISPSIEGGTTFPDDDIEPLPMHQRIQPVLHDRRDLTWQTYPDLDVSPEPTPLKKKGTRKSNFAAPSSMQRGNLFETKTPKVRFDQMVTVKRISPPREVEQSDIIEIDRSDDTSHELSFDDERPFGDENESDISVGKENIETLPKTYSYDSEDHLYNSDPMQNIITQPSRLNIDSNINTGSFDESCDREQNSNQQTLTRKIAKSSTVKNQDQKCPPSTGIIEVQAQKMSSAKGLLIESGQTEHVLARPEFNSTLFMRKEVEHATGETIDVLSAVSKRLEKSSETRRRVLEKSSAALNNKEDAQFTALIGVEVQEDDLVEATAKKIGSRAKPAYRRKESKPKESNPLPDIMQFFTRDLQREVPSFKTSHVPRAVTSLRQADPLEAFDVYRHMRAWEEWD